MVFLYWCADCMYDLLIGLMVCGFDLYVAVVCWRLTWLLLVWLLDLRWIIVRLVICCCC